jgi:SH3 domain protein
MAIPTELHEIERRVETMKKAFLTLLLLLIPLASYVQARTYYVAPSTEVPIRTGKSTQKKIVAVLSDGTQVELLKEEDGWAYIRTQGGKEGWIIRRYLTPDLPPKLQVEVLKKRNKELKEKYSQLKKRFSEISASGSSCQQQLTACISEKEDIKNDYEALKTEAAQVIQTKKLLMETQKELSKTRARLAASQKKVHDLEAGSSVKWFLAGAGVLLLGWIIGLATAKRKRRRPSLL